MDFAAPADHRVKLRENGKKGMYIDLARELKKLWNMKVPILPIVIDALGTVTVGLVKGLEDLEITGRMETDQNTEMSPGELRRPVVTVTQNSSERPSADVNMKNSQGVNSHNSTPER